MQLLQDDTSICPAAPGRYSPTYEILVAKVLKKLVFVFLALHACKSYIQQDSLNPATVLWRVHASTHINIYIYIYIYMIRRGRDDTVRHALKVEGYSEGELFYGWS